MCGGRCGVLQGLVLECLGHVLAVDVCALALFDSSVDEASREILCRRCSTCDIGVGLGLFGAFAYKMCF
jgi:hypothetical protein